MSHRFISYTLPSALLLGFLALAPSASALAVLAVAR